MNYEVFASVCGIFCVCLCISDKEHMKVEVKTNISYTGTSSQEYQLSVAI